MSNDNSGHEEFDDLIDKAIDEMFVSGPGPEKEAETAPEEVVELAPQQEEAAEEPAEEADMTITWDQADSEGEAADAAQGATGEESQNLTPEQLATALNADDDAAAAADAKEEAEEEYEEGAPRMAELKPVYQALLTLDWDISTENIESVENEFESLRKLNSGNYHLESAVKLALITCKYLRASKVYATPLAIKYLREAITSCEVFLSERGPGRPSPEALTNDLLGLYNDMKLDANRLRAVAIKGRAQTQPAQPTQPKAAPAAAAREGNPVHDALMNLWDSMEQIRGRLRGASAQGAPFAEAIDASCAQFQLDLKAVTTLAKTHSSPNAKLDALERTAQELDGALRRFKEQLAELRG